MSQGTVGSAGSSSVEEQAGSKNTDEKASKTPKTTLRNSNVIMVFLTPNI
jgi:hypothetical protein